MWVMKVAVVGCGYWGRNLVRNFHQLGALAAISDARAQTASQMSATFGVPAVDLAALWESSEIPAVAIAAPAEAHRALVAQALAAGKHVFVEKPLALHLSDAEALCASAEKNRRVLMVGHLLQYHPAFLKLKEIAAAGELGRL